jgi:hypothetical protein
MVWGTETDVFPNIEKENIVSGEIAASRRFDQEEISAILDGRLHLIVFGEAKYWDVFGDEERSTKFCVWIRSETGEIRTLFSQALPKITIVTRMAPIGNSFT